MAVEAVPVEFCQSMHPLDITLIAQQADPLLTVQAGRPPKAVGGFKEPTVEATVARMRTLDGCGGPPAVASAGRSIERTWTCAGGSRLRYVWYPGGSHSWRPPGPASPGRTAHSTTPGATDFVAQLLGRGGPPPGRS
jgi:poly(3-hydroxybutyrate) depolymerase